MKLFKALFCIAITVLLVWALQTKFGDIPPIGEFLNPVSGFWQNAESKNIKPDEDLHLEGLQGKVTIRFDEHRIPHIFAENDHDLYYAQGYLQRVTAFGKWIFKPAAQQAAFPRLLAQKLWRSTVITAVWA